MSRRNVEIVGQIYEAVGRDDSDGAARFFHPDVELHGTSGGLSEGSVTRGIEAVRATFDSWDAEAWEQTRLSPREFIDVDDRVVVLQHERRRGRGSGVEVESETAVLFDLRDGLVTRLQGFMDQDDALEAAGLAN